MNETRGSPVAVSVSVITLLNVVTIQDKNNPKSYNKY